MKLSEAMRLGAMLHPQHFYAAWMLDDRQEILATCALGAANVAGYEDDGFALWAATCPVCANLAPWHNVSSIIAHLNDDHRWTRETIADWVETIEPADDPPAPATTADAVARTADLVTV